MFNIEQVMNKEEGEGIDDNNNNIIVTSPSSLSSTPPILLNDSNQQQQQQNDDDGVGNDNIDGGSGNLSRAKQVKRHIIGTICVLIVVFLWVSSSIVIQIIFTEGEFDKPFFLTYYSTSIFSFYLFGYIFQWKKWSTIPFDDQNNDKSLSTLIGNYFNSHSKSYATPPLSSRNTRKSSTITTNKKKKSTTRRNNNSITNSQDELINQVEEEEEYGDIGNDEYQVVVQDEEVEEIDVEEGEQDNIGLSSNTIKSHYKHSMKSICKISLILCPIWFIANYTFNLSLDMTTVSTNTILSTLSGIFSLIFSVLFKVDKFTFEKLAATLISLIGIVMVSYSDITDNSKQKDTFIGDFLAVLGALFYGLYCTLMKKMIKDERELPIPLMFGLLGLFNLLLMWPFFLLLNFTGWESFQLPSGKVFLYLFANGIFGTFVSDLVESYSVVLTSPVINTIGLSLSIPLAMISDFVRGKEFFGSLYIGGSLCVVFGFILANLASKLFEDKLKRIENAIIQFFKQFFKSKSGSQSIINSQSIN